VKSGGSDIVDQRRESRKSLDLGVIVTCLSMLETSVAGRLRDISEFGLGLTLGVPMTVGTTVAVEWDETVALGQIVYCCAGPQGGSNYDVGFRADYIIIDRTTH
jgi:hypothetical protein